MSKQYKVALGIFLCQILVVCVKSNVNNTVIPLQTVRQFRKRGRLTDSPPQMSEPEDPVAMGYWGKPVALSDAKNDFLCLRAVISSTKEHHKQIELGWYFWECLSTIYAHHHFSLISRWILISIDLLFTKWQTL